MIRPSPSQREQEPGGAVVISEKAVADLVAWTVLESYGIVGMASPSLYRGVARLLTRDRLHQGIRVESQGEGFKIDLYVVVEYGLNVAEVAGNLRSRVTYNVEHFIGRPVTALHIHVQGVRVGDH